MFLKSHGKKRNRINGVASMALLSVLLAGGCVAAADTKTPAAPQAPETATAQDDAKLVDSAKADKATDSKTSKAGDTATPAKATKDGAYKLSPEAEAWLDKLEQRASKIKSLQAEVIYDRIQALTGDEQTRFGSLYYKVGPPATFSLHFNKLRLVSGRTYKQDRWYVFDGVWMVERQDDKKRFVKQQVVPPAKNKNKPAANPLADGFGPFVIPLNFKKKPILDRYEVTLVKTDPKRDPKDSLHLRLKPRKHIRIRLTEIDLWYSTKTLLPIKARTNDRSDSESIIKFKAGTTVVNKKIDPKVFDTTVPEGRGWKIDIKPWKDGAAGGTGR